MNEPIVLLTGVCGNLLVLSDGSISVVEDVETMIYAQDCTVARGDLVRLQDNLNKYLGETKDL